MLKAAYTPYNLIFKEPAMTSRATMTSKLTYFVKIWDTNNPDIFGLGECALFEGLSYDDRPDYITRLESACKNINDFKIADYKDYPSIVFGIETAISDLANGGHRMPFNSSRFSQGEPITINGLVWMGNKDQMIQRVEEKLLAGFKCIKFKIGGIDFNDEINMIRSVRDRFSVKELEIRLDANGGFTPKDALRKLNQLADFDIHSVEQPIKPRQWNEMNKLCQSSPIDIALDEELIGIVSAQDKEEMLDCINPTYIILKPSLCGGFCGADEWIKFAEKRGIGWWATSALESNIGLNAIARWVDQYNLMMPQGLGTGGLYTNNILSPIQQVGQNLVYNNSNNWQLPKFQWITPI